MGAEPGRLWSSPQEQALYQEIVDNALAATGAHLVVLAELDPARQRSRMVAQAGVRDDLVQRALTAVRRTIPGFDPMQVTYSARANPLLQRMYETGTPIAGPFEEITAGTVDARILRLASTLVGFRQSYICPLHVAGAIAGSLAFHARRPPTAAMQRVCQAFARQAALTLENAQLMAHERRQRQTAETLHAAALHLAMPVSLEPAAVVHLLTTIVQQAAAALGGVDGALVLAEDAAWSALAPNEAGQGPDAGLITLTNTGRLTRVPWRPEGSTSYVLTTGEAVVVPDTRGGALFSPSPGLHVQGVRAFVKVPLAVSGHVLGSLAVNVATPGEPSRADRQVLELLAAHAAYALERLRTSYREQRRRAQAEDVAATLAAVGAADSVERAVAALVRGAVGIFQADKGVGRLFDPHSGAPVLHLRVDLDGQARTWANPTRPQPGSFADRLLAGGAAVLVDDYQALAPGDYPFVADMAALGNRSALHLPIDAAEQRIGVLHLDHHRPGWFSAADLALAEALAAHVGAVIERARTEAARRAERKEAEAALWESEARYRAVVEHSLDAIAIVVGADHLVYVNPAFLRLVGASLLQDVLDAHPSHYVHQDDWPRLVAFAQARQRGEHAPEVYEYRLVRPDGSVRYVEQSAVGIAYRGQPASLVMARDITERRQQTRLEGALLVARRVAHDVNNALMPISGFAELLMLRPTVVNDPTVATYVELIRQAGDDIAAKVQQLQRIIRLEEDTSVLGPDRPVLDLERSTTPRSDTT
ncbi:MAG: GAF domain-containing protein [Chloroflexi bacterium]|nr:GAF domain-containing protein [Chloroflexota bacterium]